MLIGYEIKNHFPFNFFILNKNQNWEFKETQKKNTDLEFIPSDEFELKQILDFLAPYFSPYFFPNNNSKIKEVTFFGGSFNPWHQGHDACTQLMKSHLSDNHELVIIPDINPWKNNNLLSLQNRWELFIKINSNCDFKVFPNFLFLDDKNPTINWIRKINETNTKLKLNLLMGFDSFSKLDLWKDANQLLNFLSTIYVASRNDKEEIKNNKLAQYSKINSELKFKFLGNHEHEDVSSTKIRENLGKI